MSARRLSHGFLLAGLVGLVAACGPSGGPGGGEQSSQPNLSAPTTRVTSKPLGSGAGQQAGAIGSGPTKVALILPMTQNGATTSIGSSLRNAAELAYAEAGTNDLTILVKDDKGSADGAHEAAQQALGEGAELVLGPLFAGNVREAAKVARAADKPVIGFSTDAASAGRGVYLLSFLIENYVDRIVDYAGQQGKKSYAALVPESDYGNVALAEFQQAAAKRGARVEAIERYKPGAPGDAVARIAAALPRIDGIFIPEQADGMAAVAQALTQNGIDSHKVQLLGTGIWNDARVFKLAPLQGAWFATPENAGFNAFSQRYKAKFGSEPARIATLAYDAITLVAALARTQGAQRFALDTLTNTSGFNGADGLFRFRTDGPNERGLAVLQIDNSAAKTVSPAPRSFTSNPSAI